MRLTVNANERAVQEDIGVNAEVLWRQGVELLDAEGHERVANWSVVEVQRDLTEDGEVLDQAAALAFWGVTRAHHAPLAGLQRARSANLAGLFEAR